MIVRTNIIKLIGAAGVTIFPFIFINPAYESQKLLDHELIHFNQQKRWALYGLGIGLLVWFFLYLCILPIGWNPFRYKWESEAYRTANFLSNKEIKQKLQARPYFLWWH